MRKMIEKERMRPGEPSSHFEIEDSGEQVEFDGGMVRDIGRVKVRFFRVLAGPMLRRWAEHLHKGQIKYPDVSPGVANWTLAKGEEELQRFKESALDHMIAWLRGETSEDHASGIYFNVNGAEYVKEVMKDGRGNQKDAETCGSSKIGC